MHPKLQSAPFWGTVLMPVARCQASRHRGTQASSFHGSLLRQATSTAVTSTTWRLLSALAE
jgi:hypothetical protein